MSESPLQPLERFHDELRSLVSTGIETDLGIDGSAARMTDELERIHAAISVRVGLGQTLAAAIGEEATLPPKYRAAAMAWVRFDSPSQVLDAVTTTAERDLALDRAIRVAFWQTAMTLGLVCIGLAFTASWLSPRLDSIYEQLQIEPSWPALWLATVRDSVPLWATAVAFAYLVIIWFGRRSERNWGGWWLHRLPLIRRRQEMIGRARSADFLADWLRHDLPLSDGVRYAGAFVTERTTGTDDAALRLPPLIDWAVTGNVAGEPRWSVLQTVAEVYREMAQRQVVLWFRSVPLLIAIAICGFAVLLYALGVFLPVIALLEDCIVEGVH